MNNDIKLSKLLGGLSLCLGAVQILAPQRVDTTLGLGLPLWVIRLLGLREAASGFVVLAHPDQAPPIGIRLAGDALDLAVLSKTLLPGHRVTNGAIAAMVMTLGITALDLAAGVNLRRRAAQALATAERTRTRVVPAAA